MIVAVPCFDLPLEISLVFILCAFLKSIITHLFTQQVFVEYLPRARHVSGATDTIVDTISIIEMLV